MPFVGDADVQYKTIYPTLWAKDLAKTYKARLFRSDGYGLVTVLRTAISSIIVVIIT